jgi:diketogulonate reductase-like aldo/keto reductase
MVVVGTFTLNETEAYQAVNLALKAGFTGAHCDWTYFNLPGCSKALHEAFDGGLKRQDLFLMASVGGADCFPQIPSMLNKTGGLKSAAEQTKTQIDETFQRLKINYLDHLFLHQPPAEVLGAGTCSGTPDPVGTCKQIMDQWGVMEEYHKNGKIKSLGISNFCPDCFKCLDEAKMTVKPVLNQLEFHVGWGKDPFGIWTYNRKRGIVPQAYTPLGGRDGTFDPTVLKSEFLKQIGAAHNKSAADVALKWLVDNNIPLSVQSMNPAHLASDIDLWSWSLTTEEMASLDKYLTGSKVAPSFECRVWNMTSDYTLQI